MTDQSRTDRDESPQWLTDALSKHLDNRVDNLDQSTINQLSAARNNAIAQLSDNKSYAKLPLPGRSGWRFPVAGIAACFVVAMLSYFLLPQLSPQSESVNTPVAGADNPGFELMVDIQMLSASDDLEFFQTIELLEWMEKNAG